jgi:hypothetical protein
MPGATTPERIDLAPGDAAIVVREDGEIDMFIPNPKGEEPLPPDQVILAFFGMAFHDERLHDLLAQIVKEKHN